MIGERLRLEVGDIAHGGHAVARHDGRVVFVRHALPGEVVRAVVTKGKAKDVYLFADAVEILSPAAERVTPPCPVAGPGGCGGCDFQHVEVSFQRELKARVVAEQLYRLGGIEAEVEVEAVPGDDAGLRWRTRMEFATDRRGRAGLRRFRSRDVVALDDCPIAVDEVRESGVFDRDWPRTRGVEVIVPNTGGTQVVPIPGGVKKAGFVTEEVEVAASDRHAGFESRFQVPTRGFWQVHPGAASTLVGAVLDGVQAGPGERCWDLYAGVGLFASALSAQVGSEGQVTAVESEPGSVDAATRAFATTPGMRMVEARTEDALATDLRGEPVDVVVLDPPRSGAGAEVMRGITGARPRVIAYVACDPAALGRDLRTAGELGYRLADLRAFDLFPMTHHVECVAILTPQDAG